MEAKPDLHLEDLWLRADLEDDGAGLLSFHLLLEGEVGCPTQGQQSNSRSEGKNMTKPPFFRSSSEMAALTF